MGSHTQQSGIGFRPDRQASWLLVPYTSDLCQNVGQLLMSGRDRTDSPYTLFLIDVKGAVVETVSSSPNCHF